MRFTKLGRSILCIIERKACNRNNWINWDFKTNFYKIIKFVLNISSIKLSYILISWIIA